MTTQGFIKDVFARFRNLILYSIIGGCTSLFDFLVFSALTIWTPVHYLAANAISCSIGILSSFLLNRRYNFKVMDHAVRRMASFFSVGIVGLALSSLALHVLIERLQMEKTVSKAVAVVAISIIQYCLNKYISFRKDKVIPTSEIPKNRKSNE